jgi:serine protease Do
MQEVVMPEKRIGLLARKTLIVGLLSLLCVAAYGQSQQGLRTLETIQSTLRAVAQRVQPTVVEVNVVDVIKRPVQRFDSPFEFFFGPRGSSAEHEEREFRRQGLGSGVIVRKTGAKVYVLTNNHVVGSADEISVKLTDGRQFESSLVGRDEKKDLALVVFETREAIPVAELGDSDQVQVGDWALAIGNPFGFESTVTLGIVSAVGRPSIPGSRMGGFTDYIQTDAAINQGNSGGALVDMRGKVIGINTWIASPSGGSVGLGFAIPVNNAKKAIDDFITKGKVEYGWLGITVGELQPQLAEDMKLQGKSGAFVFGVFKDSPAEKAKVMPGDLVTRVGDEQIRDSRQFLNLVGNLVPGDLVRFDIIRQGRYVPLQVRIEARLEEKELAKLSRSIWPGMSVVKITDRIRQQLDIPKSAGNVIIGVVRKGSPSDVAGFRTGDIIKKLNGKDLRSVADFYRILNDASTKQLMFSIYRKGSEVLIGLVR